MPKQPLHFDSRNISDVLRLRFRDWQWPLAVIVVVAIPFLGHTNGTYQIGSITYYATTPYAYVVWLAALVFIGIRWFAIGRLRPRIAGMCGRCNYLISGSDSQRCPECGADKNALESTRRVSFARIVIDIPSVFILSIPVWSIGMIILGMFGIIDLD